MTIHHLPRVARRILNKPQLISERGALAVLGAIAPRIGVACVVGESGAELPLGGPAAAMEVEQDEAKPGGGRLFDFDPESGIAHIPIEGELVHRFGHLEPTSGMTGYDGIKVKINEAKADPAVRGIFLDIDSPGGEVFGADAAAEVIFKAREAKPIWALINEQACSAAYWLASAADRVFAPPTADSGSIGVVVLHTDISGAQELAGLKVTIIHAGAHKVDGHPFAPLPDSVKDELQVEVETLRQLFAGKVARNRGMSIEAVLATEARVFMGADGVAAGLVDGIALADDVIQGFAARLASEKVALLPAG